MEKLDYLETEKISTLLRKFAIPCISSMLISCFYNIVDQIFVGNGIGYLGNAATGVIFPITVIGWGISLLFGDGCAAFLSVSSGKGDTANSNNAVGNAVLGSFTLGCILIIISYSGGNSLLRLIGATEQNLSYCHDYGYIIYSMIPLALVQNTLASIIRADGNPRYAMLAMLSGAIINIIGDPIAIFVLGLGIKGAAWATIIGQFVSFILCILYLPRAKTFTFSLRNLRPNFHLTGKIMALGSSSFLTQISIVFITVINNILLVKYGARSIYGQDIPLASITVIMKLFQIVINVAIGIAVGAQPIVGFNYGRGRIDRVKEILRLETKTVLIVGIIAFLLFEIIPSVFINMFGNESQLYKEFAVFALRVFLSGIALTSLQKAYSIFLQSLGKAKEAAPLSIIRDALLIVLSLILPPVFGLNGILFAAPVADVISIAVTVIVLGKVMKTLSQESKRLYIG